VVGVATAALVAACSGPPPVAVPEPDGRAAGCARLHRELPGELAGRDRRDTTPASDRTAAWGEPAVVLRCGVARPAGLTPTAEVVEVDGVAWFLAEPARAYVFTTAGRRTHVQLRVPRSTPRDQATAPLVGLSPAIRAALRRS
jgi:hypothetical protein